MKIFIECSHVDQLSFWDALIITAAAHADCEIIWTEDLNAGQMIRRVRVENPLQ
jgi:predicted nucleic acid-binding protein